MLPLLLRVSTALLGALCSACATLQPAAVVRAGFNAKWRTHHDTLASIQHFTLNGRAASGVGVKADLRWQQFDDGHFEIRIAGPFGAGAVEIGRAACRERVCQYV